MSIRSTVDTLLALGLLGAAAYVVLVRKASAPPVDNPCAQAGVPQEACAAVMAACHEVASMGLTCARVVSVEPRTWSDSSLGCPRPGLYYAPVQIPGWRIVLEAQGQTVEVHTDQYGRLAVRC